MVAIAAVLDFGQELFKPFCSFFFLKYNVMLFTKFQVDSPIGSGEVKNRVLR